MNRARSPKLLLSAGVGTIALVVSHWAGGAPAANNSYQNPVLPGDHPDPSIIRVGNEYWATATSSEWGPQFELLHSVDLVNWNITGTVFPHRPAWASANFWAPELSEYKGRYFVYYVGRKRNGPLSVAVATAEKPGGPYTDHGPLVSQEAGSIDPVAVTDEKGERYLIWKEDGNSRKLPTIIWAQRLSKDGWKLLDQPREILRNDTPWEGAVVEGPFILRHNGWFYLFYSGAGCCGSRCDYALGVARSRRLPGPWEKNPANPILAGNTDWKCPGHGSIVHDQKNRDWLLYHAYSARDFIFTGREAMLDEVIFGKDGWPTINGGKGPSSKFALPFKPAQKQSFNFEENFASPMLKPGWQWPQDREPSYKLGPVRTGTLLLASASEPSTNMMAGMLARPTLSGDYSATTVFDPGLISKGGFAGIAVIGDMQNAVGLSTSKEKLILWRLDRGNFPTIAEEDTPNTTRLQLRITASAGRKFQFASSSDGKNWTEIGGELPGDNLPPWDRSIRVGLVVGGTENAFAKFNSFRLTSNSP